MMTVASHSRECLPNIACFPPSSDKKKKKKKKKKISFRLFRLIGLLMFLENSFNLILKTFFEKYFFPKNYFL